MDREPTNDRAPVIELVEPGLSRDAAPFSIDHQELIETVERLAEKGDGKSQISDLKSQTSDLKSQISNFKSQIELPESQDPNSPPFNLDEALARLNGEVELFSEMVRFFYSDGVKLRGEIQAAAAAGDAAAMEKKAHRLKGTVLYLGAAAAIEAVARVEALARSGDLTGAAPAIESMEKEMTRLAEALRPYGPDAR